jgi:hypothetical protein
MTMLGNVSRHQPLPTNADQPVASSAYITGLVRICCPNGAVAAACAAHHGKNSLPKDAANQIPSMVKGQRRKIRNYAGPNFLSGHKAADRDKLET